MQQLTCRRLADEAEDLGLGPILVGMRRTPPGAGDLAACKPPSLSRAVKMRPAFSQDLLGGLPAWG